MPCSRGKAGTGAKKRQNLPVPGWPGNSSPVIHSKYRAVSVHLREDA
jgi:hypothetical protein